MNKLIVTGRWTKDIDLRYLNSGTAIAKSTIAVDSGFGDNKKTAFIDTDIWSKLAESAAQYSGKGRKVLIEGRIEQENWEKDGQKRSKLKLVAEHIEFLDRGNDDKKEPTQTNAEDPFANDHSPIDISESDLPF